VEELTFQSGVEEDPGEALPAGLGDRGESPARELWPSVRTGAVALPGQRQQETERSHRPITSAARWGRPDQSDPPAMHVSPGAHQFEHACRSTRGTQWRNRFIFVAS